MFFAVQKNRAFLREATHARRRAWIGDVKAYQCRMNMLKGLALILTKGFIWMPERFLQAVKSNRSS